MKTIWLIAIGGALGSVARYGASKLFIFNLKCAFPLSTFIVNVLGSFIIGFLSGILLKDSQNQWIKYFWMIGFCGGFTTFSAFSLENYTLIKGGYFFASIFYSILSVVVAMVAIWAGLKINN